MQTSEEKIDMGWGSCSHEAHHFVAGAAAYALDVLMSAFPLPFCHEADVKTTTQKAHLFLQLVLGCADTLKVFSA